MFRRLLLLAVLVVLAFPAATFANSILVNGSFELGPPPFGLQDIDIASGSSAITDWIVTGGGIDLLEDPWDVSDGLRAIDLDGRAPGGIEQTFTTDIGQRYLVKFDLSGNPGTGLPGTGLPTIKQLRVGVDGFSHDYSFDSTDQTIASLLWETIAFTFIATGSAATLSFTSLSPDGNAYGALIDNVNVRTVPEPPSLALLASGLAGVAVRFRRRP